MNKYMFIIKLCLQMSSKMAEFMAVVMNYNDFRIPRRVRSICKNDHVRLYKERYSECLDGFTQQTHGNSTAKSSMRISIIGTLIKPRYV